MRGKPTAPGLSPPAVPTVANRISSQAALLVAAAWAFAFVSLISDWGSAEALAAYAGAAAAGLALLLFVTTSLAPVAVVAALVAAALDIATVNQHAPRSAGVWYALVAMVLLAVAGSLPTVRLRSSTDAAPV